jgi:hypothetical protein
MTDDNRTAAERRIMETELFFPKLADEAALREFLNGPAPDRPIGISFGGDQWGLEACRLLAAARPEFEFHNISFRGTGIGWEGLTALVESPVFASVRSLAAEQSGVANAGVAALAASSYVGNLKKLYLCNRTGVMTGSRNRIDDSTGLYLSTAPYLAALEELDLWNTDVGDEGLLSLFSPPGLPRLSTVTAWETRLTADGAERVKAAARQRWEETHAATGLIVWCAVHTDYDPRSANPWSEEGWE